MTWNEYLEQWAEAHNDLVDTDELVHDALYRDMGEREGFPTKDDYLEEVIRYTIGEIGLSQYDFVEHFINDILYHISNYDNPIGFFRDLSNSGCASGMIGSLIYNSDCKEIYIENIDSMEDFILDEEEELGEPIQNRNKLPRYVFVCWLCFEEMCYKIARELFPDEF